MSLGISYLTFAIAAGLRGVLQRAGFAGALLLSVTSMPAAAQTTPESIYNSGSFPSSLAQTETDADTTGTMATYSPGGGVPDLSQNVFFQALGTNGRSCATCHQPPSGMGLSLLNIQARYTATGGLDPLFATIDGATCPSNATSVGQPSSAYSLLLNQGLMRVPIALPVVTQFTITVLSDPYGCNTNPLYNQTVDPASGKTVPVISVYRRPSPAANLPFVTNPIPAERGAQLYPPALNWDGRATSLTAQATEAVTRHFQALVPPTADQIAGMVAFESGVYSAQYSDTVAGSLTGGGGLGGPQILSTTKVGVFEKLKPSFTIYNSYANDTQGTTVANQRLSISRGETIFNTRPFTVSNVEGIPNQVNKATCEFCHSQVGAGNDPTGERFLLGVGVEGSSSAFNGPMPSTLLPTFQVTCKGSLTTQHHGSTVITSDPGKAMTSGLCIDIAKFKVPPIRGLAGRAPYFFDGSAPGLVDVVNFYNTRFSIGLSSQDIQDLVNFLSVL